MDEKLLEKAREFLRRRYPQIEAAAIDDLAAKMYERLAEEYIVNAEGELEDRVQPVPMPDMVAEGRRREMEAIAEAAGAPPREPQGPQMVLPSPADLALREALNPWGLDGDQAARDMDPLRVNKELLNPWGASLRDAPGLETAEIRPDTPPGRWETAEIRPDTPPGRLETAEIRRDAAPGAGVAANRGLSYQLALQQQILGEEIAALGMGADAAQADNSAVEALGAPPPPATGPEGLATPPPPAPAPIAGGLDELAQDPTLGSGKDATWMLPGGAGTADITNPTGMAGDLIKQGDEDIEEGITDNEIAGMIVGGAGLAAAIGNTIADFRTTRAWEKQLAASAAGDTVARQEGALGGARAQRNIMATSLGRRDISPALAMRNAQMTGARAMSDIYGTAAVESARERRQAEAQLAQLRKRRWNTLFSGLTNAGSTVGSFLTTEGAAQAGAAKRGGNDSGR